MCVRVCACVHVLTDRVGVLMLKWSTHPDRLALLRPGPFKLTDTDSDHQSLLPQASPLLSLFPSSHLIHA